ncbi:MAG TPA: hypothetical protein VGH32_02380, partial [Pirellulales bacterium]
MSDAASQTDLQGDDDRLCKLLDRYVEAVQSGDGAARDALVSQHQEISVWANQLDALDRLAIEPSAGESDMRRNRDESGGCRNQNARRASPGPMETTPWSGPDSAMADGAAVATATILGQRFGNYELLEEAGR